MAPHWLLDTSFATYAAYLEHKGSCAVTTARSLDPATIVQIVKDSGLRGRGGAGFPAGKKWQSIQTSDCPTRTVVVNAAEGEPGTYKDRFIMLKNPYAMLEGMLIAAHTIGAEQCYIATKDSFTRELERLEEALTEIEETGLCNGLEITIVKGPDDYLYGEEKALLNVIEGGSPMPREAHYPPYIKGLFATPQSLNPALVSNVETFARVPDLIRVGPMSFCDIGTEDTTGPIIVTLSGDVAKPGMYEIEPGVTLQHVLYTLGGGPANKSFKAVLSGVASGIITPDLFDTPVDFASLQAIGSGLGSAGFIAYDDTRSMVRVAQMAARFLYVESCNQCSACKFGLGNASRAIDAAVTSPSGSLVSEALLGVRQAPQGNRCYLPVQGSKLIPSIINNFPTEFSKQAGAVVPVPKIVDYQNGKFSYEM